MFLAGVCCGNIDNWLSCLSHMTFKVLFQSFWVTGRCVSWVVSVVVANGYFQQLFIHALQHMNSVFYHWVPWLPLGW